ncbi:envelope-like protein [Cucumis melo var. makuwa]|uniref:Envelope-like protein n=1 Tax=Cucumis melo var. makuwa TaxID=1194695 RepID=A0A5A7VR48_CUCMM|nr:envelope-like protein [Cucumis melo var. makuwa]TYJ97144.1 envelope-like protein [Cucumis melo var. makuwa]
MHSFMETREGIRKEEKKKKKKATSSASRQPFSKEYDESVATLDGSDVEGVYSSATCVSTFMAPSSSKDATTKKGKRYKGIPTKHPYKKIHRSVTASEDRQQSLLTSQSASSSVSRTQGFLLSTTGYFTPKAVPSQTMDHEASDDTDEDYVPVNKETLVPEETTTSTKDYVSSPNNHTSESQQTEELSESFISMLPPGHVEEGAHKWKYVVRQSIADEANISNHYSYCTTILDLIRNAGILQTVSEVGTFDPRLIHELIVSLPSNFNDLSAEEFYKVNIRGVYFHVSTTGGTVHVWPVDGQLPVTSLTVKYAILHRIGISNWIPSTHASTISTSLGHFVYLVGTEVKVNVGEFIFNHLLRHVDTYVIHIPICFPRILSGFILSQHPTILIPLDTIGTTPRVISLSMRLFQVSHVLDIAAEFENVPRGTKTTTPNPTVGQSLVLSVPVANCLLQALLAEFRSLTRQISDLSDRRTALDAVLRDLRCVASGSLTPPPDQ